MLATVFWTRLQNRVLRKFSRIKALLLEEDKMERYEYAKKQYESLGVNVDEAIEKLKNFPVSMHCW